MGVLSTVKLGSVAVCANFIVTSAYDTSVQSTVQSKLSYNMKSTKNPQKQGNEEKLNVKEKEQQMKRKCHACEEEEAEDKPLMKQYKKCTGQCGESHLFHKECVFRCPLQSCSICLENGDPYFEASLVTTGCDHKFHAGCLQDWIKDNASCPNCRGNLDQAFYDRFNEENGLALVRPGNQVVHNGLRTFISEEIFISEE